MTGSGAGSAVDWLVSAAPDPQRCKRLWERDPLGVVLLPAGRLWDVLLLPGELGRPTLDVLLRCTDRPGPVLAGTRDARTCFFVPPGTADRWLGKGVRSAGEGTWIAVPHPERLATAVRWLVLPDGDGSLNDPALLELAMHEAAASGALRRGR
ncbi:bifunctional DNA primase/polymerase [Streptomyces sp. NA04227]|uniref:bifunctional DNA primase/polymerase n=1 Tax=Streptomyces sp. NA04227 TaxID=2742136 RepID=UPI00159266A2|nr:bifunctional DNA primase/polymerase [Streptomyces sp. NA04227]QKW09483.1 bifunctional DNA primase/polymerase [Streptomyces sp. NA04227]